MAFMPATSKQHIFGGRLIFEMWGRKAGNMSLAQLPELPYQKKLAEILDARGIRTVFAPNPGFNAFVCNPDHLQKTTRLPNGATIYRGCMADGIVFRPERGTAFMMSPADCGTGIAGDLGDDLIACLHCGTKSLIDVDARAEGMKSTRVFESALQAALNYSGKQAAKVFFGGSIAEESYEHPFDHPEYGDTNRKWVTSVRDEWLAASSAASKIRTEKGCISLAGVFASQAYKLGVPVENISYDTINTAKPEWWSNRCGDKERNLVLVYAE